MYSVIDIPALPGIGFPIQKSSVQSLFSSSPKLIAAYHVFHRHPAPRHPPSALYSLAIIFFHLCSWVYYLRHLWNYFTLYSVINELITLSRWARSSKLKNNTISFLSFQLPVLYIKFCHCPFFAIKINNFNHLTVNFHPRHHTIINK